MPGKELAGAEGVVGEQEVVDRVAVARGTSGQTRFDPRPHPGFVRRDALAPFCFGEDRDHAEQDRKPGTALLWCGEHQ